jgi:multidrug resistance efflux pump
MLALAGLAVALATVAAGFTLTISKDPDAKPPVAVAPIPVQINGKLVRLLVRDGDAVNQGQLIGFLDSSSYEADLKKTETELQQLQAQTQSAITPLQALPGMSGILPRQVPQPEYVSVPVKERTPAPQKPVAQAVSSKDPFKEASAQQERARSEHERTSQALALASADLADAQKARDALRPKITQAEASSKQAESKAASGKELLLQGAVSRKENQDLIDAAAEAAKALTALQAQVAEADRDLAAAQDRQQRAQKELDSATAKLKESDSLLAKAASIPAAASQALPKSEPPKPAAATKIVMRKMRLSVHESEPPAIPLKVLVDEKTMQSSEAKIAELKKRIEALKARIEDCKVFAPATGFVQVRVGGSIAIKVAAGSAAKKS